MKKRLVEFLEATGMVESTSRCEIIADELLTNGVIVPPCKVGDTVKAGQILTSGFEDYGLCLKAVRAEGEIFGRTWYTGTVLRPAVEWEKAYTGQVFVQRSLIVGRKRINLSERSFLLNAPSLSKHALSKSPIVTRS